jgi:lipid-binding SYLF domain-containing protein
MKRTVKLSIPVLAVFLCMVGVSRADQDKTDATARLQSAATTLRSIAQAPDKGIPDEVLKGAKCIAVVPRMLKGGFIVGAKHGRGVSTCKLSNGKWSAPAYFVISGGSWGAQIGVENVELVMMIMNDQGMRHLLENKFQVGASASASAGPVGRHASAGTDWKVETEMLTYSRSKGLFAGVDLGGSWVERDDDTMDALYGKDVTTQAALTGKVPAPAAARPFLAQVARVEMRSEAAKNQERDRN